MYRTAPPREPEPIPSLWDRVRAWWIHRRRPLGGERERFERDLRAHVRRERSTAAHLAAQCNAEVQRLIHEANDRSIALIEAHEARVAAYWSERDRTLNLAEVIRVTDGVDFVEAYARACRVTGHVPGWGPRRQRQGE